MFITNQNIKTEYCTTTQLNTCLHSLKKLNKILDINIQRVIMILILNYTVFISEEKV